VERTGRQARMTTNVFEPHVPRPVIEIQFSNPCSALDSETYNNPASHSAISVFYIHQSLSLPRRQKSFASLYLDIFISSLDINLHNLTL